ncbi:hypothetical protein [Nocardiopsis algeriensis]|uniref:Adhesin n=1 Tax=Nocardiopsis algeriensis TaxID=1478215 RepID=A0A841IT99_9ACTN|nr:hypothetical protein [Nocardiopsis algeriensis]MBB6122129.1 hypothetical protein [Nocardiopsis algeriensis]
MHEFPTPTPVTAVLDIPAGRIRLIAADRTDTTVEILPADPTRSRDVQAAQQVTATHGNGVLRIEAPPAPNRLLGARGAVEVTVQLPTRSHVEATAAHAELRGVGRLGDVTFTGQQATVELDETLSAHLTTQAGDISISAAPETSASLDAGTPHGRIHNSLKNTGGTPALDIHATTSHGDITARSL